VGTAYTISQSYCDPFGGHSNQLAYDFAIPVGADVIAARAGVVRLTRDDVPDDGSGTDPTVHNHIYIQHTDNTVAFYAHLQQSSVAVQVGQSVSTGQRIAASGNSGNTGGIPHLHFGVYRAWPTVEGEDLPVNFRNAEGPLDSRGGLQYDSLYTALPF
jgi:murein DD-endopeptidase MepM/ murein hydrolase activator NlpD